MGGTISAQGTDRLDRQNYTSGIYEGNDFLEDLPELNNQATVDFFNFSQVSSTEIDQTYWLKLRSLIVYFLNKQNYDGVVITHGTSTLEETAYFLHLTIPTNKPVVLVGAQRPYSSLSSDAHLNLIQAIKVATSDESYNKGVLVALNNEINSAREASKSHTYQVQAFTSFEAGDRKSTRLNSSHVAISYAVFCVKKKKNHTDISATYLLITAEFKLMRTINTEVSPVPMRTQTRLLADSICTTNIVSQHM